METISAHYAPLQSAQPSNLVSVTAGLWNRLTGSDPDPPTQISLAVRSRYETTPRKRTTFSTLVVKARQASKAEAATLEDNELDALLVPRTLIKAHPAVFAGPTSSASSPTPDDLPSLAVAKIATIPLSSVILVAEDDASYAVAQGSDSRLKDHFSRTDADIVRQGDAVKIPGVGRWKVAMTEPVLQGEVQPGQTQLLVLPPTSSAGRAHLYAEQAGPSVNGIAAESALDDTGEDALDSEERDDFADFDLDEGFLASSVLLPRKPISTPLTSPRPTHDKSSSFPLQATAPSPTIDQSLSVAALPLAHSIPGDLLAPLPDADEDDILRAFVTTHDLGRMGLFSGDWAVLRPVQVPAAREGETERPGRLVRIFAADAYLPEGASADGLTLHVSPPLLFNLFGPASLSTASALRLHVLPTSSLSVVLPAPLPLASSVTIARLATPHSVNKVYQPLFIEALKDHFQRKRRKVVQGDVIAVGIEEDKVRFVREGKEDALEEEVELPQASGRPTAVVYFLVAALAVKPDSETHSSTGDPALDAELEAGRLGAYVDPQQTKLMQTGLERGRIPGVASWLGCDSAPASVPPTEPAVGSDSPTPASRLSSFVLSALTPQAASYALPLTVLLHGARGSGKRSLVRAVARTTGISYHELDCYDLLGDTDAKTEGRLRALAVDKALACAPVVLLLRNIEALARKSQAMETGQEPPMTTVLRDCFENLRDGWMSSGWPVFVVATTTDLEKVPTGVLGLFKEEIALEAPGESERLAMLKQLTARDVIAPDVSLRSVAVQTAALVAADLVDLVRRARAAAVERVLRVREDETGPSHTTVDVQAAGLSLISSDLNAALDKARSAYSESIGAPKIPNVTWDDVGGLANVKSDILDTIQLPLEHPELFADGLKKRSGILLYGPPGTGKTLLAKAVATSCSLNFFSVKGPELLNMYIGESEANVRRVFQRARDAKPCVIFFDELDSVAPKRGNQGDSGGVMDRIVSQLLAELDGMSEGKGGNDVFVIGATNRPDLLDPALLRPGRFDRMLYLGVSDNHAAQLKIMQALTRKFKLAQETDLERLAEQCPFNYTGADFYALCSDAMLKAMTRKAGEIDQRISELNSQPPYSTGAAPLLTPQYYLAEMATPAEIDVLVAQQDFEAALAELVPSVSQAEMQHYRTVQQRFSAETLNSDDKLAEKEKQQAAAQQNGSRLVAPQEMPKPNGHALPNGFVNGHPGSDAGDDDGAEQDTPQPRVNGGHAEDGDKAESDEEEKRRRRMAKGKGKARAD